MLKEIKNESKIKKIIIALIVVLMILFVYIKVEAVDLSHGIISPIYKPVWTYTSALDLDADNPDNSKLIVTLKGTAYESQEINSDININYASDVTSTLDESDIKVFINGVEVTEEINPEKDVSVATITTNDELGGIKEVTHTLTLSNFGETVRQTEPTEKPFKEWSGNVSIKIAGRGELSETYNQNVLTDIYGNQNMMATDETGVWVDVEFKDGEIVQNTDGILFADFVKPEFTYRWSDTTIGSGTEGDQKVRVVFDIVDQYFNSATIDPENITIKLLDTVPETTIPETPAPVEPVIPITKEINKKTIDADITNEVTGVTYETDGDIIYNGKKIGERYELVISNLDQGNGFAYSGPMSITIPNNVAKDNSDNQNDAITITIGINETDGNTDTNEDGSAQIVDVVKPVWELQVAAPEEEYVTIRAKDKYYSSSEIDENDISIYVNGQSTDSIVKILTGPVEVVEGQEFEYTVQLSNITLTTGEYVEFTPTEPIVGGTAKYKAENGGLIEMQLAAGTIIDQSGNTNEISEKFVVGNIDQTKPEIYDVQKIIDENAKTTTFIFNVTDRNYDSTDLVTIDEISVWLDGNEVEGLIANENALTYIPIKANIDGTVKILGHQYTLVLSNIVETSEQFAESGRKYQELSGNIELRFEEDCAQDLNTNPLNPTTLTISKFVDLIKPEITYKYVDSAQGSPGDINYESKTFTMVFEIVDKYFKQNTLVVDELEILIDGEEPEWRAEGGRTGITRNLHIEDIKDTFNKTIDGEVVNDEHTIGKRYTLTLSNIEQLQIKENDQYLDYSGVITVSIPQGKVTDTGVNGDDVTPNENTATTITSGIDIPGGVVGDSEIVDVVDPSWSLVSTTTDLDTKTSTIIVKGTDKYLDVENSTLTSDKIKLFVNGTETTGNISLSPVTVTKDSDPELFVQKLVDGTVTYVQIGIKYIITVTDFVNDKDQVKIQIADNILIDESGNKNKVADFYVYNTLKKAKDTSGNWEENADSGFLGNENIERQYIEKIIFTSTLYNAPSIDEIKCWDVSAQQDDSILAWYNDTSAPYTIYIGSNQAIRGNIDSSYLFSYIGYDTSCQVTGDTTAADYTARPLVENIELLNVAGVTNMSYMFNYFGYRTMKSLDLGNRFDTGRVTNMSYMFNNCGYTLMTNLDLGDNFKTNNVLNMKNMFANCGYKVIPSLNLGNNFKTENVETMDWMFSNCGNELMTSLNLGTQFDTSSVTSMEGMFSGCGNKNLTSLDLGDLFYTNLVTNMSEMFNGCGSSKMTALDLGPAFSKISGTNTNFVTNTGKSGSCVIYAPESIYKNKNAFKLDSTDASTTISYTRGTINIVYKPEWTVTSSIDISNQKLNISIKGNASKTQTIDDNVTINYLSDVTGTLALSHIKVFVDETEVTSYLTLEDQKPDGALTAPATSTGTELTYTLTLSDFEEATRQAGKQFKEWSGNISIKIAGRGEATTTYTANVLKDSYGNQSMMATDETGTWTDVEFKDSEVIQNTNGTMFSDFVKPEFTYEYSNTTITHGAEATNEVVTVVFDVVDKFFKSSQLTDDSNADLITLKFDDEDTANNDENVSKTLTTTSILVMNIETGVITTKATNYELQTGETKVGERYQLVITGLDQEDGFTYSGYMTLVFNAGIIEDKSGNTNNDMTITIGKDEPTTDSGNDSAQIVDVADPIWDMQDININHSSKQVTASLIAKDKYFRQSTLTTENITIYIDGEEVTTTDVNVKKSLSIPEYVKLDGAGNYITSTQAEAIGQRYTLTLTEWQEEQRQKDNAGNEKKSYLEWSGTTKIVIDEETIEDNYTNKSIEQEFTLGHVDFIKPEIVKVSSTKDNTAKTETIVFTITDKYYDTTDTTNILEASDIKVYIDEVQADGDIDTSKNITKQLTYTEIKDATRGNVVVGYQYTLVLSDFEKVRNSNDYQDWSGTVSIEIAKDAIKDTNTPTANKNDSKTIVGDFVDFIKPDIKYEYQSSDINRDDDTYTMTFSITDKYYTSGILTTNDITNGDIEILMQNGQLDSNGDPIIYNLKDEDVTLSLVSEEIKVSSMKMTNTSNSVVTATNQLIGHKYTLTISDLEKSEIASGFTTTDYSGVISLTIEGNKVFDRTVEGTNNPNDSKTITSVVSLPNGTTSDVVDTVDPVINKVSSLTNAVNQTAEVTFKVTDTYFKQSKLTTSNIANYIKVFIDGTQTSTPVTIEQETELNEDRLVNNVTTEVQYGIQYKLKITGFAQTVKQVKIQIQEDMILDESGNGNRMIQMILYNTLKLTDTETESTSAFLGIPIEREDIENVTLLSSRSTKGETTYDVSAQQDNTIIAWYTTNANGAHTVYIASDSEIYANQNSSYLFSYIGYGATCTATQALTNINKLNTNSVKNMGNMFSFFGYKAMTSLDLSNIDTTNVTNMKEMFNSCGYTAMTTLNLGTKFNTNNVTDMNSMFMATGYTAMTNMYFGSTTGITTGVINFADNFNTTSVADMSNMFKLFGYTGMTKLNLGNSFNTGSVTTMESMFEGTGYTAMTSLDIGDNFNTSNVLNMNSMFKECGYTAMTSLDLSSGTATTNTTQFNTSKVNTMQFMFENCGNKQMVTLKLGTNFDTREVLDMTKMFAYAGQEKMTSLNLGEKFKTVKVTNMEGMFTFTGYSEMTALKLGSWFNTSAVTNMKEMFKGCGYAKLTSLDLGDLFYTNAVTDMSNMFYECGQSVMTVLDIGPVFTRIASTNTDFITNTGKSGVCVIYAPESIYKNKNAFKLNSTDTSTTISYTRGTINPIYKPEWTVTSSIDETNKKLNISIKGNASKTQTIDSNTAINYSSNVTGTLELGDIRVFIDETEVTSYLTSEDQKPDGALTTPATLTGTELTYTLTLSDFEEATRQTGKQFKEWSGNISIKIAGRGEATTTYTENVLKDSYGNQSMMAIDETGTWTDVEFKDSEVRENTNGTMFADFVKPEFTYEYSNTTITHGTEATNEVVTVVFDVVDKFFKSSQLTNDSNAELITLKFDNEDTADSDEDVSKTLTTTAILVMNTETGVITTKATNYELQTGETKVGERYQLVITGLDQGDGFLYSGYMTLVFDAGIVKDESDNGNNQMTITIGKDEPTTDSGNDSAQIVDVVDPAWELGNVLLDEGAIKIKIKDKYLDPDTLPPANELLYDILVYVNGQLDGDENGNGTLDPAESSEIIKSLTGPVEIIENQEYEYALILTNITPEGHNYREVTTTEPIVGGTAKYREDNSGEIALKMVAGTVTDQHENTSNETILDLGMTDRLSPEIFQVSTIKDVEADTETIIFNVTDRNYHKSDPIEKSEMTVWMDGVQVDDISKTSLTSIEIKTMINGAEVTIGHQYTLVLSDISETVRQIGKNYLEWSGSLEVRIEEEAAKDAKGNTLNTETTTLSDFVDYIRPEIKYVHQNSDIIYVSEDTNNNGVLDAGEDTNSNGILDGAKSYTMTFEIVDKYYDDSASNVLTVDDLSIFIQNGQLDSDGNLIVYDLKTTDVTIGLNKTPIRESMVKTTDIENTTYESVTNEIIGYRYNLTISDLEKLLLENGNTTANYSGVISVAIAENAVYDESTTDAGGNVIDQGLGNAGKTITSGITFKDGVESGDEMIVDVVDPVITKVGSSANAIDPNNTATSIAYLTFKVTDTYFAESKLTNATINDYIKVVVDGSVISTATVTIEETTPLKEDRLINNVTTEVQYGIQYRLKITGFAQDAKQVKIRILENMVFDRDPGTTVQNSNKTKDLTVYNTLELTSSETEPTSGFLGSAQDYIDGKLDINIQRQNIENVTFLSSTASAPEDEMKIWDVSILSDNSLIAWYTQTATQASKGTYTVYIASDDEIFANYNSSYLFANIGYSANCVATQAVTNLNLLKTGDVANMSNMFKNFGYRAMTTLNLGTFDTSNVTLMNDMFNGCGYTAMTTFSLGSIFKTNKVTNMASMFSSLGYTAMTSLNLGNNFNTSNVTNMNNMFAECGHTAMTSLVLGSKFDTSNVTNMNSMFKYCGYGAMTSLDLSSGTSATNTTQFNTTNVTDMSNMFDNTGWTAMTTFKLGNNFDTSKVTTMGYMFCQTGYTVMTSLDLGNKFDTSNVTDMQSMFNGTGCQNMTSFKLGNKFNTAKVTNMNKMFTGFGYKVSSLDLGDLFYTTSVTNMTNMFKECGLTSMTTLDLGPVFTRIASINTDFITDTGKSGECIIYAPESIYNDMTHFKLNRNSGTTIQYTEGTINPIYKPKWEKVENTTIINETAKTLAVTIKGYANETFTNGTYTGTYSSAIKSYLPVGNTLTTEQAKLINVYIDDELDGDTNGNGILDSGELPTIKRKVEEVSITGSEVQYKITLSGFEQSTRQTGKNFKEWSGNISIQPVDGTLVDKFGSYIATEVVDGYEVDVPKTAVFTDADGNIVGNANMQEIDYNAGTWIKVEITDTTDIDTNTDGKMFADYVKPEFTYKYTTGDINYNDKKLKVVFDITDKYFNDIDIDKDDITVALLDDATSDINTKIVKTLAIKTIDSDVTDGKITYKTDGSIYYDFDGTSRKIGTRYELIISNIQQNPSDGYTYSGPISLSFLGSLASDKSGNLNDAKTITIGVDEPGGSDDDKVVVDVTDPIWTGPEDVNKIKRTRDDATNTDTVNITILGSDKYYDSNSLATNKIKVYIDDVLDGDENGNGILDDGETAEITKSLTEITNSTTLQTLATNAGLEGAAVGYTLTLGSFGNQSEDISGKVKIVIEAGTLEDESGNVNQSTTIDVGNINWTETGDNSTTPRYPAFRNNIVDFIKPIITYNYSTVEGSENPDVDYEQKTVTVKFTVTDKYLIESDLIETTTDTDGNTIQILKNASILVDSELVYLNDGDGTTTDTRKVTTRISSTDIKDTVNGVENTLVGKEYTLVVSNIQQENEDQPNNTTPENGDGFNFSGPMQLVFAEGSIDDKSGNKNDEKTITLDTEIGPDVVDVVDPIIYYSSSSIDRTGKTVTLMLCAEDKYLTSETLVSSLNNIQVKVVKPNGETVTDRIITKSADGSITSSTDNEDSTITKVITRTTKQPQYMMFRIIISNFGEDEGITSVIIPKDTIFDTSGNGNIETEILVGNTNDGTAFKDSIVDFTQPIWQYVTSSIQRDFDNDSDRRLENGELSIDEIRTGDGTVTLEVKATDIYFDDTYYSDSTKQLNLSNVKVYVNDVQNTRITKAFATNGDGSIKKEYITENAENGDILKGIKYTLILGNFETNDGTVKIEIPADAVRDISINKNILTPIDVGNPEWVEDDEPLESTDANYPKYTAFRNNFVDYIKPVVTYETARIDRANDKVIITFNVTDTNFLESNIGLEDIKVFVDDDYEMQVYGTGADSDVKISAGISHSDLPEEDGNGIRYTLTLSDFGLDSRLTDEMFLRHSGRIRIIIAEDQVFDTSGNPNNETEFTINEFAELDGSTIEIADLVKPIIYYNSKYINWNERYAEITLRATDRFYDSNTQLKASDLTLYEEVNGQYVQITDFNGKIQISRNELKDADNNLLGYDYVIKLKDFEEEFQMKVCIPEGYIDSDDSIIGIGDTSGNLNEATEIIVGLDNQKPRWEYVSTDTTKFESQGKISFNVKGVDKFLNMTNSNLAEGDVKLLLDGQDITNAAGINIAVTGTGTDTSEKSKSYKIDITGLTEVGTYSLVFEAETLIDEFLNKSAAKTITFSKSAIVSNTGNYTMITYHVSPDQESVHSSYVHELMSVNTTGTNFENTTYRPSTLGELHNNGENALFAEPMYDPYVDSDGYTVKYSYAPKSFAGWAEADENGNQIYYTDNTYTTVSETQTTYTRVYGLYDEIPKTITNLKAIWQEATVVFVSNTNGNNSNNGQLPTTPVKDIETAYSKLNSSGTSTNNIIVIMDAIEWGSNSTLSKNATITSLYAGVDYRLTGAELKISSNMTVNGDIIFDNIELYSSSTTVSTGTDYLGNGTYTNMLISNYSGDIILGRGITTPDGKYTFGAIIGGNYKTETSTGELGTHTIRVEAGKYNNIIAGSTLTSSTTTTKSISHGVVIGNMRDTAIVRNDKLTITGYVSIGENEQKCYPSGATATAGAASKTYSNVILYSGTITGANKFAKTSENAAIYLRSINGTTDGQMIFNMFGGVVNNNIYGSASSTTYTSDNYNTMNFYGGQVTGEIFGQSANDTFKGGSTLTFGGNFSMTGNIFGGSNVTTSVSSIGTGSSNITINSSSTTINGNIYGGSKSTILGYVEGTTTITLNAGTVNNIYGGGYGCDNTGATNIIINNGTINQNIYGGAYQGNARLTSNITVLGGTIGGNIYGGNHNTETQFNSDTFLQDVNITIGDTDSTKKPTINGIIYGSGIYDKIDTVTIQLIECANITSVYGGSNANAETATANIYLKGMTVNEIYGGGQSAGTVETSNIYLQYGAVTDVYGGGFQADVTTSNVILQGTTITDVNGNEVQVKATVTSIYGGSNTSGTVTTSNVTLKSGNLTNVFGGGNSAVVGTAKVTLDGITIGTIHGGSKDAGVTTNTNVTLTSGTVTNVFGGGLDVGVTTSNVTHQGTATVTNIYGGNNSGTGDGGDTGTTNINMKNTQVANIYGGNYLKGTTRYTNITIQGTSIITGKLFGGGYKSAIGKSGETGSTTIDIDGGTINGDINGGSEDGIVYGTTNINIGVDATGNSTSNAGNISIEGNIYGGGTATTSNYSETSVQGSTHILIDNNTSYPITFSGSIFGSGNGTNYYKDTDSSTIDIKDLGTSHENTHQLISVERTGQLRIGNSFIEFIGRQDQYNYKPRTSYSLNRMANGLIIYNNTTLYTRRGFNMVNGFGSYKILGGSKATVSISGSTVTTNGVDNRLYTLEGINLIFAKQEGNIYADTTQDIWGDVNGMAFFGMYSINRTTNNKEYDIYAPNYTGGAVEGFFANGTYIEGRHKSSHDITTDGFYTNIADYGESITVTPQVIEVTDYGTYYDWIIGADVVNYEISLIASAYGKESIAEVQLDYQYAEGATYTFDRVSTNALNTDVNLINSLTIPTVSEDANTTFGLTMETINSGWLNSALSNIYTADNGSFDGDILYKSDYGTTPGTLKFRLYNSINITEQDDFGNINVMLTGKTDSNVFKVVIAVNIQAIVDELDNQYETRFTDTADTELSYTTNSKVDLTYMLYNFADVTPYETGDYRVISSTVQLPIGTRLTLKDYGQGDSSNKVYYYHVTDSTPYTTETKDGVTRYIYRLSEFIEMGSTTAKYADSNSTYYHTSGTSGYIFEKYDISIDFEDANIAQTLANETYLELRSSSNTMKYDNGDTEIKYNLYSNKDAVVTETISNNGQSYSVVNSIDIPFTLGASIQEKTGIMDTRYYDKISGIAIEIINEQGVKIDATQIQNFKLTNADDETEYYRADSLGVIRVPIMEGISTITKNYKLSVTQVTVNPGVYTVKVYFFTSDDGEYYGTLPISEQEFNITFINRVLGLTGVEATADSRIISKTTGKNLEENDGIDMTISIVKPTSETNIRVELYKRNPTYTDITDETTYSGTSYTLVDITQYLEGTWQLPSIYGLTAMNEYEYIVSPKKVYESIPEMETIELEKALKTGISTGEYKLVFKAYHDDTLIQSVKKTFVVTK